MKSQGRLTTKQENFCVKYVETGESVTSYRYAYDAKNMKDGSVRGEVSRLLNLPKITHRIAELRQIAAKSLLVSEESVLKELARIAFADIRDIFENDMTTIKPMDQWSDDIARVVAGIDFQAVGSGETADFVKKLKLYNKLDALKFLVDRLDLLKPKNDQSDGEFKMTFIVRDPAPDQIPQEYLLEED